MATGVFMRLRAGDRVRRLAVLALLLILVTACSSSDSGSSEAPTARVSRTLMPPDTTESLLFVARADTGSLIVGPSGESTLELDDVDAITWFSDRPDHDAGTSSVTDALEALGWERNGGRLGDDAPNAVLTAGELGENAVVVELLTATRDGNRVRFAVEFVSQRPESTGLSHVDLFIDNTVASSDVERTPSGLELQESGGIVLGRTTDHLGQPHTLALHLNPRVERLEESLVMQNPLLAVVSGSTMYSTTGDVAIHDNGAVGDWRFKVDSSATGDDAPIIVFKFTSGALADLAAAPNRFFRPADLIEDEDETIARLNALIQSVVSHAASGGPDAHLYGALRSKLLDPEWFGVLIFNATVAELPDEVLGQSTAALADAQITAVDIGFSVSPVDGTADPERPFSGTIDHPEEAPGEAAQPDNQQLRAVFHNSALTWFNMGTK